MEFQRDIFLKTKKGINGHLLDEDVENDIIFIEKYDYINLKRSL